MADVKLQAGNDNMAVLSNAVLWYAVYLDYLVMDVATIDSRLEFWLRKQD
jgi:hypothetical protein